MDDAVGLNNYLQLGWMYLMRMYNYLRELRDKKFRRWWVKPHLYEEMRMQYGAYATIFMYFKLHDHEDFVKFTGLTVNQFIYVHELVETRLTKRNNRKPLSSELKLAAVLK